MNITADKISVNLVGAYALAVFICMIFLTWVMSIWKADLSIPFYLDWDWNLHLMLVKGIVDNGWYNYNPFIGAPEGLRLYDFPMASNLDMSIIKLITLFTPNYALATNFFLLVTFPLTTITAMMAFRQFKFSYALSILGGLLYTFMPYHFIHWNAGHLFLAAYYIVPLIVMVTLWIYEGSPLIFSRKRDKIVLDIINMRSIVCIVICLLVSFSFIYYPFFSCFLLLVTGVFLFVSQRNKLPLLRAGVLITIIFVGVLVSNIPTIIYQQEHGKNPMAIARSPSESEYYGLKINQFLMPVSNHRIPLLAKISKIYTSTALMQNEGTETLGILGSIGFLILILYALSRIVSESGAKLGNRGKIMNGLGIMNLSSLLLATIGGFGSVFAYLVMAQIRCYGRISIFIGFFSIFALLILLAVISEKYVRSKETKTLFLVALAVLLVAGILDQTSPNFVPRYNSAKAEFLNDAEFVDMIEKVMPTGAMIFQLPYASFPESPWINRMADYSHFKGYLHSKKLKWSYGTVKGREGDAWQKSVTSGSIDEMVEKLYLAGFNGIYVDTYGYEDSGAQVLRNLKDVLGTKPIVSADGRLYFFKISLNY